MTTRETLLARIVRQDEQYWRAAARAFEEFGNALRPYVDALRAEDERAKQDAHAAVLKRCSGQVRRQTRRSK